MAKTQSIIIYQVELTEPHSHCSYLIEVRYLPRSNTVKLLKYFYGGRNKNVPTSFQEFKFKDLSNRNTEKAFAKLWADLHNALTVVKYYKFQPVNALYSIGSPNAGHDSDFHKTIVNNRGFPSFNYIWDLITNTQKEQPAIDIKQKKIEKPKGLIPVIL